MVIMSELSGGVAGMAQNLRSSVKETLDSAADSIKRGDIARGREGLERVLSKEPENVLAWLWMSRCVQGREQKLEYFRKVLELDPNNNHALEGIRVFSSREHANLRDRSARSIEDGAEGVASKGHLQDRDYSSGREKTTSRGRKWLFIGTLGALLLASSGCLLAASMGLIDFGGRAAADGRSLPTDQASTQTQTPTSTPTSTLTATTTSTPTARPTRTLTSTPTLVPGSIEAPLQVGDSVVLGVRPKALRREGANEIGEYEFTLLQVVSGPEAAAEAKKRLGWSYKEPIDNQEYIAIRGRLKVLWYEDNNKVENIIPYTDLTLRYSGGGDDTWGTDIGGVAEGYPPIEAEFWQFYLIKSSTKPLLYFQPLLIAYEQMGFRTEGVYFQLLD